MSEIRERINREMVAAMKARASERAEALKYVKAILKNAEIEKGKPLDDGDVVGILHKLCRQRLDSIEQYQKGNRQDLVDKEKREIGILEEFLPKGLSEQELQKLIDDTAKEVSAQSVRDMGKLIKAVMAKAQGRADGRLISDLVKKKLA